MKLRPLHDRVLLKRQEAPETTAGGLFIPDKAKEKPTYAEVIAVGAGKLLENGSIRPLDVKVGDVVLISKYSGVEVKLDGEDYVLLREEELVGIFEKTAKK
jgi:chaperonin GroES